MGISVYLLDVEGTTTPVDFVYGTLFPFAREHLASYLHANHDTGDVLNALDMLVAERAIDSDVDAPRFDVGSDPLPYLLWLISKDRKSPALKSLQGKVWEHGYRDGTLKGEVYPDVAAAFKRWTSAEARVCIYSSGSVLAQQLLFRYSDHGDLTPYISAHFDTAVGPKGNVGSYVTIARELSIDPSKICFVSDITTELDAAAQAGFDTVLSLRPGNKEQPPNIYHSVSTFDEIA